MAQRNRQRRGVDNEKTKCGLDRSCLLLAGQLSWTKCSVFAVVVPLGHSPTEAIVVVALLGDGKLSQFF